MFSPVRLYERARHHQRRGWRLSAEALLQLAIKRDPELLVARRELRRLRPRPAGLPDYLRSVVLGTIGTCNASCVHCPTGKAETAHAPRGPMPMPIFKKIINGIYEFDFEVRTHVSFGLFGDGLLDPFVLERSKYLRETLPSACLSVNTNGAAFNPEKHAPLFDLVSTIALHCESLDANTFNFLMQPLRFERVSEKYSAILAAFPGKVRVSVPVSRRNIGEAKDIRRWFLERGAREVAFDPLSSRCSENMSIFNSLALSPHKIACKTEILRDLIVDCDGLVLACCNDFRRQEPIGDLGNNTLTEALLDPRREAIRNQFDADRHDEISTCSKCFGDVRSADFPFDVPLAPA